MSTHVVGFRPPDERWRRMKAVWDACAVAGVPVPAEVEEFFQFEEPDESGVEVELPVREWRDDHANGFEVHRSNLPPDVEVIRFYNAW